MFVILGLFALIVWIVGLCICVQGIDDKDGFVLLLGAVFVVLATVFLVFH